MEHNQPATRTKNFSLAALIVLCSTLLCLLVCTILLCASTAEQFLPLIVLAVFFLVAFIVMRTRWAMKRVWLFYALCAVFAIACGFLIRAVF